MQFEVCSFEVETVTDTVHLNETPCSRYKCTDSQSGNFYRPRTAAERSGLQNSVCPLAKNLTSITKVILESFGLLRLTNLKFPELVTCTCPIAGGSLVFAVSTETREFISFYTVSCWSSASSSSAEGRGAL